MTINRKENIYVNLERDPITASPAGGTISIRPCVTWGSGANSLSEEGNRKYDYFFAAEAPDDLLLVESWTTPELQQAHCQTEIFAKLQALKAQFCENVEIDKFDW